MAAPKMLDEIRKAPESHLSQPAAANIIFQIPHTFHPKLLNDYYHFDVVRKSLTQNLPRIISELVDETHFSLDAEIGKAEDWKQLKVFPLSTQLVTRIANRMMVGLELCRNDDFLHYSATYTKATFDAATMLRNVPEFLKPLMMWLNTSHKSQQQVARKLLVPLIKARLTTMENDVSKGPSKDSSLNANDACKYFATRSLIKAGN